MNRRCCRQRSAALRRVWMLLLFAAFPAVLIPVKALRSRSLAAVRSTDPRSSGTVSGDPIAFLVSVPRGGADTEEVVAKGETNAEDGVDAEDGEDFDETEVIIADDDDEENAEPDVEKDDVGAEDVVEEVDEVAVEEEIEESILEEEVEEEAVVDKVVVEEEEEDEDEEDEEVVAEEVDEEEEEVVFPTDEIPSDDVRSFHTTDGELADDEGVYTDGQNESPMAENEAASEAIGGATQVPADDDGDDGDDDEDNVVVDRQQEVESSAAASEEETSVARTAASVAVIDDALQEVLMTDFRYTKDDISRMRPEIAAEVVRNKLARPKEGIPKNWYSDPEDRKLSFLAKKKGLVVSIAAVGVAALTVGLVKENDAIGDTIEDIADALRAVPKSFLAIVVAAKNSATKSFPGKKKAAAAPAIAPESESEEEVQEEDKAEDVAETTDTSVHSIKPGTTAKEVPDPEIDHTWLDKLLTRIERGVSSLFSIKI